MVVNFEVKKKFKALALHLFPPGCILCGQAACRDISLCMACQLELPWLKGSAMERDLSGFDCQMTHVTRLISLFEYRSPIDFLIRRLKFNQGLEIANVLAQLLAQQIGAHYQTQDLPQVLIPMPLHKGRLRHRGFNQAIELSQRVSATLRIPIDRLSCTRNIATAEQSSLSAAKRMSNVKDAFQVKPMPNIQRVAIIDDVVTTGHTVNALARALKRQNITTIDIWCIALTPLKSD